MRDGEFELIKYRSRANKLVASYGLQEGSGGEGMADRLGEYAAEAVAEVERMGDELRVLKEQNAVIRGVIFGKMYGKYQMALAETYIYGMEPKEVAAEVNMGVKQFYKMRDRAVEIYARLRENEKIS